MVAFHKNHGGEGTIMVTRVKDPSKYGVVVTKPSSSMVERFVEKPKEFVGDRINAGIYMLDPKVLDRIEVFLSGFLPFFTYFNIQARPMSIEKEVFPPMALDGQLHVLDLEGFWADVGQPSDYLEGTSLFLNHLLMKPSTDKSEVLSDAKSFKTKTGSDIDGPVLIDPTAIIGKGCKIGPNVGRTTIFHFEFKF